VFCLLLTVGCVISPRRTLGGGGGTPTPTPTPSPTGSPTPTPVPTGKLYVMNQSTNTLLRFDNAFTANGSPPPAATIKGSATTINGATFMTLDTAHDSLYIANTQDLSIIIYDGISTKNGNVAPSRTISGALTFPTDVSLDKVRNLLYVADGTDIFVYASASTANGTPAPARNLTVNFGVSALFIDGTSDRLYLADQNGSAIAVYDHASTLASGQITANRAVQGATTQLALPTGVQVDGAGRLVVSNFSPPSITIYANAATADGDIPPVAQIAGTNTGLSTPNQIFVDTTGTGTLYNADPGASRVAMWSNLNTANANVQPTRTISGAATGVTAGNPQMGLAFDNTR
jgi:6-phosphogluconolactonase (cycloisomerase 2 family)